MNRRPSSRVPVRSAVEDNWLSRVRGEYLEMPGLSLTARQAQRLWGLDPETCEAVLEALVHSGFLRRTTRGYVRADAA
jgi:hypothetical protein